jgi:hypothetical protein
MRDDPGRAQPEVVVFSHQKPFESRPSHGPALLAPNHHEVRAVEERPENRRCVRDSLGLRLGEQIVHWPSRHRQPLVWLRHANSSGSAEITDQDDVTALTASGKRQLPAVTRPVEVEGQSRFKIHSLFRRSAAQFLSPDVGDTTGGSSVKSRFRLRVRALLNLRHWNRLATRQSITFSLRKPETI